MSITESHLAQEAIAALVDGELAAGAANRAARHLTGCAQCRLAVQAQREAKEALHDSDHVRGPDPVGGDRQERQQGHRVKNVREDHRAAEIPSVDQRAGVGAEQDAHDQREREDHRGGRARARPRVDVRRKPDDEQPDVELGGHRGPV